MCHVLDITHDQIKLFFIHAGALHFINRIANKTPEKVFFL